MLLIGMRDLKAMRLFVAVPIPEEIKKKVATLGKEIEQEGIKLVKPENMHLTMKFIGEVSDTRIGNIEEKLKGVAFRKFNCSVRGVGVFPDEKYIRVVWTGIESNEIENLAEQVINALAGYGKKEPFSGHVTIARVKRKVDLKTFLETHKNDELGQFDVSCFELIQSELTREGPKYSVIATFEAEKDA